ncbi:MAG: hypothetical protein QM724_09540 [Flavobacteriales bacterium]
MIRRTLIAGISVGLVMLTACRKDRPEVPEETPVVVRNNGGAYITNEGNFQWGNASVSYYDIATGSVAEDLYAPANGAGLGDVCQSMSLFNGKAYVVVNNSGKVVVVDPATFTLSATITGFRSPRYFLPVSNGKAYVTDLYAGRIAVVDLNSNSITGSIRCPGWTEELALAYGKAFVTDQQRPYVYVIQTSTDQVVDSIPVSRGGNSIVEDAEGKLWVACSGGNGTSPALYRINPVDLQVEASFPFQGPSDSPWRLSITGDHRTLYFLNGPVYRMAITDTQLPGTPFIAAEGRNLYGLGVEPATGVVYLSDAIDYVQRGRVFRYRPDGTLINDFLAGIVPGGFRFN